MADESLRVECAAIKAEDGKVFSVPRPGRHHDVIRIMAEAGYPTPIQGTQGFVLSDGTFTWRRPALHIAERAEQLVRKPTAPAHGLFSEDVW